jgi:hypothetical protein
MYTSIVLATVLGSGTLPAQPGMRWPVQQMPAVRQVNRPLGAQRCPGGVCPTTDRIVTSSRIACHGGICRPIGPVSARPRSSTAGTGTSYSVPMRTPAPVSYSYGAPYRNSYNSYSPISYGNARPSYNAGTSFTASAPASSSGDRCA